MSLCVHGSQLHPDRYAQVLENAMANIYSVRLAVPWYNLNCHKWCTLQPDVQQHLASGSLNDSFASQWCDQSDNPVTGRLYYWIYMAYLWKYYDFVDTALLILKKKDLIFLHVFHHATVPLCAWMAFEGRLLLPLWMGMGLNSVVHGLMYYYYYLRECGVKVWWRKLVTQIQTSQFVLGAFMTVYGMFHFFKDPKVTNTFPFVTYTRGCDAESWAIYACGGFNLAFLFLFMHWYATTYKSGDKLPKPEAEAGLESHEKTC